MSVEEAKSQARGAVRLLSEIAEITSFVKIEDFEKDDLGLIKYDGRTGMDSAHPEKSNQLRAIWNNLQKAVPPGYSVDGNLIRHISFNEAHDWLDIYLRDVPKEIKNLREYEKDLDLITYIESLNPRVAKYSNIILSVDTEAALKALFSSLDSYIREKLNPQGPNESTTALIGRAFREEALVAPENSNMDSVRNFLMGVLGYHRSIVIHKNLSRKNNNVRSSLHLFCLANEAFNLLEQCLPAEREFRL